MSGPADADRGGANVDSSAERRLDRITVVLSLAWLLTIIGLLVLYRIGA